MSNKFDNITGNLILYRLIKKSKIIKIRFIKLVYIMIIIKLKFCLKFIKLEFHFSFLDSFFFSQSLSFELKNYFLLNKDYSRSNYKKKILFHLLKFKNCQLDIDFLFLSNYKIDLLMF